MKSQPQPRRLRIGKITLHEGIDGRWNGASFTRGDSFERMLRGELTSAEYVAEVRGDAAARLRASQLQGRPARGWFSRCRDSAARRH